VRTMDDLVRQGKVRYIGLSNYYAWQAAAALAVQERQNLEKYVTAQMHYSLVNRGLEYEWLPFAGYCKIGILVWSPLAGGFLAGKYEKGRAPVSGTRFAEAGQFVLFDRDRGFKIVEVLKNVAKRHGASCARTAVAWTLARPGVSSVIIAGRTNEQLVDNIAAVDLDLSGQDIRELDLVSDPGVPYPQWMVHQLDVAEDPRPKILYPDRYSEGGPWSDLRGKRGRCGAQHSA